MAKIDMIKNGKALSKEYFKLYIKKASLNVKMLKGDPIVCGFKEVNSAYILMIALTSLPDCYCEMTFDKDTEHLLHTRIFTVYEV